MTTLVYIYFDRAIYIFIVNKGVNISHAHSKSPHRPIFWIYVASVENRETREICRACRRLGLTPEVLKKLDNKFPRKCKL